MVTDRPRAPASHLPPATRPRQPGRRRSDRARIGNRHAPRGARADRALREARPQTIRPCGGAMARAMAGTTLDDVASISGWLNALGGRRHTVAMRSLSDLAEATIGGP